MFNAYNLHRTAPNTVRGVPRIDDARGKKQFDDPMFEAKIFCECITVLNKVLAMLLRLFGARGIVAP